MFKKQCGWGQPMKVAVSVTGLNGVIMSACRGSQSGSMGSNVSGGGI